VKPDIKKIFCVFVLAIAIKSICVFIESDYIVDFLGNKIVEILITLMAINTATNSFIVSKLQDIGNQYKTSFKTTYLEIKKSIFEQIILIIISIVVLTIEQSKTLHPYITGKLLYIFDVILIFNFTFALEILRDTGMAMFDILIELDNDTADKPE